MVDINAYATFTNCHYGPNAIIYLTITAPSNTPAGTYPIAVTGISDSLTHCTSFKIVIK
jgi:uncharacterized membrane protein